MRTTDEIIAFDRLAKMVISNFAGSDIHNVLDLFIQAQSRKEFFLMYGLQCTFKATGKSWREGLINWIISFCCLLTPDNYKESVQTHLRSALALKTALPSNTSFICDFLFDPRVNCTKTLFL